MAAEGTDVDSLCEIIDMEGSTVSQIDSALEKIEDGTYGACEECGSVIARARLEALPFAGRCIGCQRRLELAEE